ncbi:hypothetical protein LAZ67_X001703 [Cordylochernes scorpioides]|uniref:Mariner Mos1 transposase n=1 Tax=Cordylochernes scorpioides TaxID=51811 RepID=A0ABY6LSN6_9ARAC|nr:hypothetical protein LAZ67_X001703 [Cordylochernes scorpioides]
MLLCPLGKTLGLEVNEPIIQELVEEEDQELTTNELIDLHREQHQEVKEVISSGEEEDENSLGSLPSDQIREICKMWETLQGSRFERKSMACVNCIDVRLTWVLRVIYGEVKERSYVVYTKQAAVSRGRTAAYRRRRCTSWKILEGSTNFCLLFCSCFSSPCCSWRVVHHEFLPQGRAVNEEYYLQVMRNLREAIRQKRPDLWKNKNWLLHHDNAPAQTSLLVRDFLAKNN